MALKTCKFCSHKANTEGELEEFVKHKNYKHNRRNLCKKCDVKRVMYSVEGNRDNIRNNHYLRYYGITLEDYNSMFQEQGGCCAICKTHQLKKKRRLAVDHCHDSGEVRGLLCQDCNTGIGLLQDSKDILYEAIKYLAVKDNK